jgi:hypothetical protein
VQSLEIPCLSARIVCTSKIGNLSVQVGVPPEVGSRYGYFEVLGGGGRLGSRVELLVSSQFLKAI